MEMLLLTQMFIFFRIADYVEYILNRDFSNILEILILGQIFWFCRKDIKNHGHFHKQYGNLLLTQFFFFELRMCNNF